jgi:hypothetical protein
MKTKYIKPETIEIKIDSKVICTSQITGGGNGNGRPASAPGTRDQGWHDYEN